MLADLPAGLHTFFLPQVQQLAMREKPVPLGGAATLREEAGTGYLWVAGLGEDCLLSVHDFVLNDDFRLREFPTESYCLSLMSDTTADVAPMARGPWRPSNVLALYQDGSETAFTLPGAMRCWATTLCFTPRYLEHACSILGIDAQAAADALLASRPNELPEGVGRRLGALRPAPKDGARAQAAYASLAFEAFSIAVRAQLSAGIQPQAQASGHAPCGLGAKPEAALVDRALRLMEANLDQKLTLAGLARELYVSKTKLCEAFREAQGAGVAECLGALRIERAKELLAGTSLSIGEVAQAVGYRHQSSFCHAFKASCGMAPSAFREAGRR